MKRIVIGVLLVSIALPAPGCTEDKCKNPAKGADRIKGIWTDGDAIKCNAVVTCPGHGGRPDNRFALQGGDDPATIDQHRDSWNANQCKKLVMQKEWFNKECTVEAFPEIICLDVDGGSGAPGPIPTGGTLVTVGVGAGSGDSWITEQGAGGAGGSSEEAGQAGHGGD
ncbi:hypothetical protein [Polyangium sorediatum]|uniref:Lipoprotein n=1 Tax=Polyangium sorediatum TaxID=889274 RepID=A0ABT6NX81_9BACT|nr:hypothetical protein [Polyangium sorediatum]MDI1432916.1 hypothetical protein [Polyangium sorediatum]